MYFKLHCWLLPLKKWANARSVAWRVGGGGDNNSLYRLIWILLTLQHTTTYYLTSSPALCFLNQDPFKTIIATLPNLLTWPLITPSHIWITSPISSHKDNPWHKADDSNDSAWCISLQHATATDSQFYPSSNSLKFLKNSMYMSSWWPSLLGRGEALLRHVFVLNA